MKNTSRLVLLFRVCQRLAKQNEDRPTLLSILLFQYGQKTGTVAYVLGS